MKTSTKKPLRGVQIFQTRIASQLLQDTRTVRTCKRKITFRAKIEGRTESRADQPVLFYRLCELQAPLQKLDGFREVTAVIQDFREFPDAPEL
jgi:hypothetical protein